MLPLDADNIGYTEWALWSICEAKCGFDEVKVRQRECIGNCKDNRTLDTRNCGLPPCPGEWNLISKSKNTIVCEAETRK